MTSYSFLSPTQLAVLKSVTLFRQLTTSQVRRLHYSGTLGGTKVRAQRHLKRLSDLGLIAQIKRPLGGYGGGSGEAVYQLPTTKARTHNLHTHDIAELYVRLVEATYKSSVIGRGLVEPKSIKATGLVQIEMKAFDPEPWCHVQVGHMELKPDAFVDLGQYRYWLEVDLGSEYRSQLAFKMARYVKAYEQWDEPTFPLVVWICHDEDRKRFIESVVKRQATRGLFAVVLFEDAMKFLSKD